MTLDNLMTPKEVAEYLGISIIVVYRYAKAGKLKGFKLGANRNTRNNSRRHWRFRREEVEKFTGG